MNGLPLSVLCLWAKKSRDGEPLWLPLVVHLADSASTAALLWDTWISEGVRRAIGEAISNPEDARRLFVFLAAAHDVGKATPVFQAKSSAFVANDLDLHIEENILFMGFPIQPYREFSNPSVSPHALATQLLLNRAGFNESVGAILGAHHGKPASSFDLIHHPIDAYPTNYYMGKSGKEAWTEVQCKIIQYALGLAGFNAPVDLPISTMPAQVLLSGLVVMTDWIASNERYFPYLRIEDDARCLNPDKRARTAWDKLGLPLPWKIGNQWIEPKSLYKDRFDFNPRVVQLAASVAASRVYKPGIWILEAATGIGKTEIALAAAEALGSKAHRTGVFFALPTQATSDGIFPRVRNWVDRLSDGRHPMILAHGKAQFNESYRTLFEGGHGIFEEDANGAYVHAWFEGQKKALLADFVVGTIDQLLMMALKQKHVICLRVSQTPWNLEGDSAETV